MSKILTQQTKIIVWQNANFKITIPHIDKFDGGHLIVSPLVEIASITQLSDDLLLEMYQLVGFCELALIQILGQQNIKIPFTNNQDNGNWAVFSGKNKSLHIHIYGRAISSVKQVFGQALYCPDPNSTFYDNNQPLNGQDITAIKDFVEEKIKLKN